MFFRNLTLFRITPSVVPEDLQSPLSEHPLREIGAMELSCSGFEPAVAGTEDLAFEVAPFVMACLGTDSKLLPSSVINRELDTKIREMRDREGRSPGGRERKRMKDEILTELMPKAFVKHGRQCGYIDRRTGWVVIDTATRKSAEGWLSALREALGSFPAVPVNAESSPRALMTAWLAGEPLPENFVLGDEVELRDPVDAGAIVRAKRQELEAEEIREHLKCGKQVFQLSLVYKERLSFVLGEDLIIRKLRFLEAATESLDAGDRDSMAAELQAILALMGGEVSELLQALDEAFGFSAPDA